MTNYLLQELKDDDAIIYLRRGRIPGWEIDL